MASTNGTIKRLVHDKGFGFIAASDGSEYFFHQSSCQTPFDELREGQADRDTAARRYVARPGRLRTRVQYLPHRGRPPRAVARRIARALAPRDPRRPDLRRDEIPGPRAQRR